MSLLSDNPAEDGKIANLFLQCRGYRFDSPLLKCTIICVCVFLTAAAGRWADAGRERPGAADVRIPGGLLPREVLHPLPLHGGGGGLALLAGLGRPPHQDLPPSREQVLRDCRHRYDPSQQPRPGEALQIYVYFLVYIERLDSSLWKWTMD